ncbi:MAG: NADP-dependent oxidoreductase [Bryobacteraceae bacterium]
MRLTGGALVEASAPQPAPGPGELLIRVFAAGVTPTELVWYPTTHTKAGEPRMGAIPGHEFSGVVSSVGSGVEGFAPGQEVFGMNDWFADGASAEYCLTTAMFVTAKPARLSHVEAASVPIGALTAWQGLFDHASLQPGERLLVHGGAGSVGLFAVQLGRHRGAHVIATASARDSGFVTGLGAQQVIDYRKGRFEESVGKVDVVLDTVGGQTLERSWGVLNPGGRLVTVAADEEKTERAKKVFFIVEPNASQLRAIADLLQTGQMRTSVAAVVPFSMAADAYVGRVEKSGPGKLVVDVEPERTEQ